MVAKDVMLVKATLFGMEKTPSGISTTLDDMITAPTTIFVFIVSLIEPAKTVVDSMARSITLAGTAVAPNLVAFAAVLANGGNIDIDFCCNRRSDGGAKYGGVCAQKY